MSEKSSTGGAAGKKAPDIVIAVRDYNARNEYELSIKVDDQVRLFSLTVVSVPITLSHKLLEIFFCSALAIERLAQSLVACEKRERPRRLRAVGQCAARK